MAAADSGVSSQSLREEARRRLGRTPPTHSETPTPTLVDAIEAWVKQEETPALPTGLVSLDTLFDGGLPLGQMTAIAAAPGVGKSALALQLAIMALTQQPDMNAAWCLGEMTRAALAARAVTYWCDGKSISHLTLQEVIRKELHAREVGAHLASQIGDRLKLIEAPLVVDKIERAVTKDNVKLLIVDYLQLVRSTRHFPDQTGEIIDVLQKLRHVTNSRNIATILVTNIAKGVDHNTEIGNIGKGSNQIDFDVDNFLFGQRTTEVGGDGEVLVRWHCKKLRQGERKDIELWFHGKYQRFADTMPVEFEEFKDPWGAANA